VPGRRRTKLIAIVSADECDGGRITDLIGAGMDLVRLSGDDEAATSSAFGAVRTAAHEARTPLGIIADLDAASEPDGGVERAQSLAELGVDFLAVSETDAGALERLRAAVGDSFPQILCAIDATVPLTDATSLVSAADGLIVEPGVSGTSSVEWVDRAGRDRKPCALAGDVAAVVAGGADAVLVPSGSDLVGDVRAADVVARRVEAERAVDGSVAPARDSELDLDSAVIAADAGGLDAAAVCAIVVPPSLETGTTARLLSSQQPSVPIVGLAPTVPAMTAMSILADVIPRFVRPDQMGDLDRLIRETVDQLGLGSEGAAVLIVEHVDADTPPRFRSLRL
jgi:pyruvate kinase